MRIMTARTGQKRAWWLTSLRPTHQEWVHTCEAAATDIVRHVYEFVRNATLRSPLVRDTIVWLVDHLAAFGATLDFGSLCEGLSGSECSQLWTDADKAVKQHKYNDTRCVACGETNYTVHGQASQF